jgi:3-deoxy-7-phosphoheptulonate synthase
VIPLGRAAAAVEAHGLLVEVHHAPEQALSDGAQSLYPEQFGDLCRQVRSIVDIFGSGDEATG